MRAPLALLLVLFAASLAGCTEFLAGPAPDKCVAGLLPQGHEVRVRVVWNATGQPVQGACVTAYTTTDPPAQSQVRTLDDGAATLRLPAREWRLYALKAWPSDTHCAYSTQGEDPASTLRVEGPAEVVLRMHDTGGLCV